MKEMDENEIIDFLMEGTRTGKLSTVQKDGRPHIAPIWFVWNEGKIIFGTGDSSVKAKNMRRNPQVSICVDDESPPYAFVIIQEIFILIKEGDDWKISRYIFNSWS